MVSVFASYLPVALLFIIAIVGVVLVILVSRWLSPFKPNPKKLSTYECGEIPEGEAMIQFRFQYYMFAIIFVVFDVVSIFLLIWAVSLPSLTVIAKLQMAIFVGILVTGLSYALKKEAKIWV
ncbi:MAG: NADH-quinone oxidoreductase subunit A [Candidatus Bathyarchaeota archaeon]